MALTAEEARTFGGKLDAYKEAKRKILDTWNTECTKYLTLEACKDGWPSELSGILQPAFDFLQQHGAINFGVLQRPPEPEEAAAKEEPQQQESEQAEPTKPSKQQIVEKLYAILRTANFEVMTEKKIRAQLAADLGHDMEPYRSLIRKHVQHVLAHMDERETVAPLPLSDDEEESGKGAKEVAGRGKETGSKGQRGPQKEPQPEVVVVGAGLAGLIAANILQHNQVKVVVLEAQQKVGGRVAQLLDGGAGTAATANRGAADASESPADLLDSVPASFGAVSLSLPSTTDPADAGGSWPDGAAVLSTLCNQLGIKALPYEPMSEATRPLLFEFTPPPAEAASSEEAAGAAGRQAPTAVAVDADVHEEAERLLVQLLSDLRRAKDSSSAASPLQPTSLGAALEAALKRLEGPAAAAPQAASAGAGDAGGVGGSQSGGDSQGGIKRAAIENAADAAAEGDKGDVSGAEGRPTKRVKAEGDSQGSGPDAPGSKDAEDKDGSGDADAKRGSGAGETDGQGEPTEAEAEAAVARSGEQGSIEAGVAQSGAAGKTETPGQTKPAVLRALRHHLLPLLELSLGGPLSAISLSQLPLLPDRLPGLLPPLRAAEPSGAAAAGAGSLLTRSDVRRLVEGLAAGLDIRTGVVVTGVTVTAAGGVKVSTEKAGTLTASAVLLAVPIGVLRSGAISLDPPVLPYRAAAAGRVSDGAAVSLCLELPAVAEGTLVAICGGGDGIGRRPFLVAEGSNVPEGPAGAGAGQERTRGSFLFCPSSGMAAANSGASDGAVRLVAHLVAGVERASALTDEELQRQAMAALRAAAEGRGASHASDASGLPEAPASCRVVRWGSAVASGAGAGAAAKAAAAAARSAAHAHLAEPLGDPRDMVLLAAPHKGRVFFAGDHTSPQQLPSGLLSALAASGVREASRVLKMLKGTAGPPAGATATGKKAGKASASAAAAGGASAQLEVGDEESVEVMVAAAEAAAAKAAAAAAAAKNAATAAAASGKAEGKPKAKVVRMKKTVLDSDEEDDAPMEKKAEGKDKPAAKAPSASQKSGKGKDKEGPKGKAAKGKKAASEDEEEEEAAVDSASEEDSEEEEAEETGSDEEEEVVRKDTKKGKQQPASKKSKGDKKAKPLKKRAESPVSEGEAEEDEPAKGGKKAKRKRVADGSDDEEQEGTEEDEEGGGGGKRSKGQARRGEREQKEEQAQLGMLDKQRKQQALAKLQADRKDLKVVYKAMMAAGNGNLGPLREQLSTCAGLDAKQMMIQAISGASLSVLQLLANDSQILTWLRDWLTELCEDTSAEHLVLAELRLLDRLPLSVDAISAALGAEAAGGEADGGVGASGGCVGPIRGLLGAVRDRCGAHRSKDVKKLAALVFSNWERRASGAAASRGGTAAGGTAAAAAPGVGSAAAQRPPMFNPKNLVSLRATPPPAPAAAPPGAAATGAQQAVRRVTPPPPAVATSGGQSQQGAAKVTYSNGSGADSGSQQPIQQQQAAVEVAVNVAVDPSLEAKLQAAKAAAEAARQEAALAAQRRAEVQQETQPGPAGRSAALPEIATFEDFKRVERGGGSSAGGSGRHKDGGGSGRSHKGGDKGGERGGARGGGSQSDLEALKAEVVEYTKQLLRRAHKAGKITTANYRLILDKATRKVFETLGPESVSTHHHHHGEGKGREKDLLGSKRREKISKLVEQYVQKMGQAGGGGVGSGAATGGAAGTGTGPDAGPAEMLPETLTPPPLPPPPVQQQPVHMPQPQQQQQHLPLMAPFAVGPTGGLVSVGGAVGMGMAGGLQVGVPAQAPQVPLPPPPPPPPSLPLPGPYGGGGVGGGGMLMPPGLL